MVFQILELSGVQEVKQRAVHKLMFSGVTDTHEGRYTLRAKGAENEVELTIAGQCWVCIRCWTIVSFTGETDANRCF